MVKLGVLDGQVGFVLSSMAAYSVFLRYLKLWRMKKGETLPSQLPPPQY